MGKFIRNNNVASILIVVISLLIGSKAFGEETKQSNSVSFSDKVFSFETLDKADKFEELAMQMGLRDLAANDKILLPPTNDTKSFQAILKIIEKDLNSIQKH